ncbi:phosphatase PAP2 family protein [Niveibacterium sp. 24ML]|uniref:phosphatase PAP2 family protein n=1 Tax=Niveibacterium sp. 24ML TaxID=2985512 RepID=UPI00226DF5A7|nr:phosphatase PAP2 family protein [Niveibacterium sp. 24ML]MCX9156581.1 phosphatase PAP2 family protein [Niveibacterium sp. 24ML]
MPEPTPPAPSPALPRLLLIWLPPLLLLAAAGALLQQNTNTPLFLALNSGAAMLPASFWSWVTVLGTGACAYAVVAPTLKNTPRLMASALLTGAFAGSFTHTIKPLVDAGRPAAMFDPSQIHIIGETLTRNSFPSGHATTAFAFAATLVFFGRRPALLASVLLPLAALVAFSRIAVGAHWPLDVLVGAAGGWLSGAAGEAISRRWMVWQKLTMQAVMALALLVMGISLAGTDLGYPLADPLKWLLSGVAVGSAIVALRAIWLKRSAAA